MPIAYAQSFRDRQEGRDQFVNDMFVVEITVKAGVKGELYETSKHQVPMQRAKISSVFVFRDI